MKLKTLTLLLTFFIVFSCKQEDKIEQENTSKSSTITQQLDSLLTTEFNSGNFEGTITVGNGNDILFQKALGTASRVWDIPMQNEYRFDIASVNKSFQAALILIAVQEGKINLEDKLVDYLSDFKYSGSFNPEITIHNLLSHTSGLADYDAAPDSLKENGFLRFKRLRFNNAEYVDFISQREIVGEPNQRFHYSNFAYHLTTILLEKIYDQHFSKILADKICKPLNLKNTFAAISNEEVYPNMVEPYNFMEKTNTWERNPFIDLTLGRRIFSTSEDLYKWGIAMTNNSILTEESRSKMLKNHIKEINPDISYGYGWVVFDGEKKYRMGDLGIDKKYIIHGGSTDGFKAMLVVINNGEFVISFLSNIGRKTNEIALASKIAKLVTGEQ